jgi:tetratricopeptide (TPR) repeat protein
MRIHNDAQSMVEKAHESYQAGKYFQAAELFSSAAEVYSAQSDPLNAAEMMNNRSVALLKAGDAAGALAATEGTDTIFATANDARRQAMALGNQAAACEALGGVRRAILLYQRSSELLKDTGERELRTYVLGSLSALQLKNGDQLQSLATMHIALETKPKLSLKERLLKKLIQAPFKTLR